MMVMDAKPSRATATIMMLIIQDFIVLSLGWYPTGR